MQPHNKPTLDQSRQGGKSGLRDPHRRTLMRIIFSVTALILALFAGLQFAAGDIPRGTIRTLGVIALALGLFRIGWSTHLKRWIIGYLISIYSFLTLVMWVPDASPLIYVWAYPMPVLSYLLLGKRDGLMVALPYMLAAALAYIHRYGEFSHTGLIDLFNPVVCGLVILLFIHLYETMRAEAENELVYYAETDALTGLPNRSRFQATYERTLDEARRSGINFTLALMDIDHFKNVNDTLGHDAGDTALQTLAGCLSQRLRSTDFVGRLGGEEFGLILRDADTEPARALLEELRQRIAMTPIVYAGKQFHLTVTFGIACWPKDADTTTGLYQIADRRMYLGKRKGRNTVISEDEPETPAGGAPHDPVGQR